MIPSIPPGNVFDHLAPAFIVEVDIQIGHGDSLRIEESLKQQIVFERIDGGDVKRIGDDGARAAAASGADENAVRLGEMHIVPDDQEVIDIAHALNDAELVIQPLLCILAVGRVALPKTFFAKPAKVCRRVAFALGQRVFGQMDGFEIEFHMAALGDLYGVFDGVVQLGKDPAHFLLGFDIHLIGFHAHAILVGQRLAGLDAHEDFLRLRVLALHIMAVVGGDKPQIHLSGQTDEGGQHALLIGEAVILNFDVEMIPVKDGKIPLGHLPRVRLAPVDEALGDIARDAGGKGDQSLGMFFEQLIVDARAVVKAARKALRDQINEVLIARLIFAQQDQMAVFARAGQLFIHVFADIDLAADDRMNPALLGLLIEFDHAVHHAVIGDGAVLHAQLLHMIEQGRDAAGAVEQAVFGV